ncbi:MAG: hypothetical protein ACJ8AW_40875 [Rhodopila sp.]
MSRAPSPALPDLDDTEFAAKLRPLGDTVIPKSKQPDKRISEDPDNQNTAHMDNLKQDGFKSRLSVAERLERIEKARGPKRRFEYLIPVRGGDALAADAAKRGQSAATRLLEVLRDAGYPVIPEDFIDLRKEKGR